MIDVTKELIGAEDLLLGTGVENQTRNGSILPITKINAETFGALARLTATTTQLEDISDDINVLTPQIGKMIYNTTTSKPVWKQTASAAGLWTDATGATAHTPV